LESNLKTLKMKLYIEENQPIPAIQILDDSEPTPTGFREGTTIVEWNKYGSECFGEFFGFNYLTWRKKIQSLMIAIVNPDFSNWNGLSLEEKEVVTTLILAPYSLRTSVFSDAIDKSNWKILVITSQGTPTSRLTGRAEIVEMMREAVSEELRVETISKDFCDKFFTDVSLMLDTLIGGNTPDFKEWLTNEVGSPYELDGFAQKTYYSVERRDYLVEIYNGQF